MPTLTINYTTESERLAYERAIAFVAEMTGWGFRLLPGKCLTRAKVSPSRRGANSCRRLSPTPSRLGYKGPRKKRAAETRKLNRLGYALRLRQGRAIGSGMIEGTIKQMVGQRLKQTGARWRANHVGPFVELRALADGPERDAARMPKSSGGEICLTFSPLPDMIELAYLIGEPTWCVGYARTTPGANFR